MTRGRRPVEAIRLATRIAEKRGEVQHFRHGPGLICMFVIYLAGCVAHVRIKRIRHLHCTEQWLEREAAEGLAALRIIASSLQISRELWICSPRGNFRFFCIHEDSIIELDRDGVPLSEQSPVKKQRRGAALGPAPETADSPSFLPSVSIPEVSVGEHIPPDDKVGEVP